MKRVMRHRDLPTKGKEAGLYSFPVSYHIALNHSDDLSSAVVYCQPIRKCTIDVYLKYNYLHDSNGNMQ